MKIIQACILSFCFLPIIVQAEIWAYQIHGKQITDCQQRPEASIDEVWNNLQNATGMQFDISRDDLLIPGYILQNKERKAEYVFYPSQHACEFERAGVAAISSGNPDKLQQLKASLTNAKRLNAMSPADIPQEQQQAWVNFFAGCTNGILKKQTSLIGSLQKTINRCDCTARKFITLQENHLGQEELQKKAVEFAIECSTPK